MEATGFPTSADIYLELDGRKIAVVQGYTAPGQQIQPERRGVRRERAGGHHRGSAEVHPGADHGCTPLRTR